MSRLTVFARRLTSAAIASIVVGGLVLVPAARPAAAASTDVLLQAPLIGQQFSHADPSGDHGAYDCLPASLTMAISALQQRPGDYSSVRQYMRAKSGVEIGGLGQTYGVVEYSTGGRFSADKTYHQVAADGWRALLESELTQGRPLVLYIADATMLEDSSGRPLRPSNESFPDAHAVLAVGILDGGTTVVIDDPWNAAPDGPGRQLRMTAASFAAAWGDTRFRDGTAYSNAGWNYISFQKSSGLSATLTLPSTTSLTPTPTSTPAPSASPIVLSGSAYVSAATLPWTDTGLTVQAGDDVTITASGTYGIAGSDPGKTPQSLGCAGDGGGRPVVVSSLMIWASIARIGAGTPFCIGTGVHIPFAAAGELFATFNDEPPFSDNWGGVTIHWQIRRRP